MSKLIRLLVQYSLGDEYDSYGDEIKPILYESAEKAIHDFERLLVQKLQDLKALREEELTLEKAYQSYSITYHKAEFNKSLSVVEREKIMSEAVANMKNHGQVVRPEFKQRKDAIEEFVFGNQSFELSNFINRKAMQYELPVIQSVDDYFAEIEKSQ